MSVQILRGNALALPLDDNTVDLVVTSPPYFGLRSYQDAGEHYDGQIGSEATPAEFVDALIAATREMVRVAKPSGSIWVNLGDKYAGSRMDGSNDNGSHGTMATKHRAIPLGQSQGRTARTSVPTKSLIGVPWRYALRCIDDLGLILRAEVIWSKPNGLPESVSDRVRRSHETWFHFVLNPRYYSAVDEIREEHQHPDVKRTSPKHEAGPFAVGQPAHTTLGTSQPNPLGKLPGSVWTIPTQPLTVPPELGVDHFAAFPMEWPRRIVTGWSPREVCTACGEGRRPVANMDRGPDRPGRVQGRAVDALLDGHGPDGRAGSRFTSMRTVTGYACACTPWHIENPAGDREVIVYDWHLWDPAPATPGMCLDPFGGTGTTALVAHALGRHGISVDMSADYCRLAAWRTSDPKELARAQQREYTPPRVQVDGQATFEFEEESAC